MKISRVIISCVLGLAVTASSALADPGEGGRHLGHYRQLHTGYLTDAQIAYAIHNRNAEMARVRSLRTIDFSRVRIVRLTAAQKARLGIGALPNTVAFDPFTMSDGYAVQTAQIFGGSGNSNQLGGIVQSILSGILVQNAINSATGGSSGGAGSLANILLNSGIPLSSLLGIFMGGNGILNAIVG